MGLNGWKVELLAETVERRRPLAGSSTQEEGGGTTGRRQCASRHIGARPPLGL